MYNYAGTSFGSDYGMDLFSGKLQIREGVFIAGQRSWMGGGGCC